MESETQLNSSLEQSADATHLFYMKLALAQAEKCTPSLTAFSVGAVLVDPSKTPYQILASGYSRELPGNTHAEQVCIEKFRELWRNKTYSPALPDSGYSLYTTMEPCTKRLSGNVPCATRLVEFEKISTVYVGCPEPSKFVAENTATTVLAEHKIAYVPVYGLEKECLNAATRGHPTHS